MLLIRGDYDEVTPVKWATAMTPNLKNSHHLIFKGWKHTPTTYWSNPCAMQAAHNFFNDPTRRPIPECLEEIGPTVFKLE